MKHFLALRNSNPAHPGNAELQLGIVLFLGGCLFKKRLSRAGAGKRGGYRVLVGYKRPIADRIIFLYAFAKSEKDTISDREEAALTYCHRFFCFIK
ncbi:MAG: hypothetical protein FDX02_02315 [Chlorobium sp.]|nr:MAG: hypothetical protein FDX02_02315 [Chlorobium sp.]